MHAIAYCAMVRALPLGWAQRPHLPLSALHVLAAGGAGRPLGGHREQYGRFGLELQAGATDGHPMRRRARVSRIALTSSGEGMAVIDALSCRAARR
jgi:hypothetical protein